jgi:predicted NACHT family NTPase
MVCMPTGGGIRDTSDFAWVWSVAFSPGKTLASADENGVVKLWEVAGAKEAASFKAHDGRITCVAFSPDGKRLATGGNDMCVRLWDAESRRVTAKLVGHEDWVMSVAFSPDGKTLASASRDRTARLWDVASGKQTVALKDHSGVVNGVACSPDGKLLATAGGTARWGCGTRRAGRRASGTRTAGPQGWRRREAEGSPQALRGQAQVSKRGSEEVRRDKASECHAVLGIV